MRASLLTSWHLDFSFQMHDKSGEVLTPTAVGRTTLAVADNVLDRKWMCAIVSKFGVHLLQ
jgi:hypothetical protein